MLKVATNEAVAVPKASEAGAGAQTEAQLRETAFRMCREFLPGSWRTVRYSEMLIRKISGGLSNLLYACELPAGAAEEPSPSRVLVRFYGEVVRDRPGALESVITECVILTLLSERQRGPRLYGVFPGGRIEEYIAARPLLTRELAQPVVSCRIAEKVAALHLMQVPMNKSPTRMWDCMDRWTDRIEELIETPFDEHDSFTTAIINKLHALDLREELAWLRQFVKRVDSPVVFCHNDLQEGNILLRTDPCEPALTDVTTSDLVIIDFEYCAYNFRGFDMANHFNEWKYDYTNDSLPYFWARPRLDHATVEQKEWFVAAYLSALERHPEYKRRPQDTVDHIIKEIEFYSLVSDFFWSLWSVVFNSNMSMRTVQFDYWCYGESRFAAYYSHKNHLLGTYDTDTS